MRLHEKARAALVESEALREQSARLYEAEKRRAAEVAALREDFLALAAHELKTPLTSLKGYAQILMAGDLSTLGEGSRRALEVMDRQIDRINRMVEEFLLVDEIRSGRISIRQEQIDLADTVTSTCEMLRRTEPESRIECSVFGPVKVVVDRKSVELLLFNLVHNALKYSPSKTTVDVNLAVEGCQAVLSVRDRGIGIPKEKQGFLFEPFYQVQPGITGGIGLGLHISQELIERQGGKMWLESAEGEGSIFYFSLPISPAGSLATVS